MNTDLQKPNYKKKIYKFVTLSLVLHSLAGASMLIISSLANKVAIQQLKEGSSVSGGGPMVLDLDSDLGAGGEADSLPAATQADIATDLAEPKSEDKMATPTSTIASTKPLEVQDNNEIPAASMTSKPNTHAADIKKKTGKVSLAKQMAKTPLNKASSNTTDRPSTLATNSDEQIESALAENSAEEPKATKLAKANEVPTPQNTEEADDNETEALARFRSQADEAEHKQNQANSQKPVKSVAIKPSHEDDDQNEQQTPTHQAGGTGESLGTARAAGGPTGVIRDGDDLIEAEGNQKPHYPVQDRLANREGTVVFLAKVEEDGSLSEIRFLKRNSSTTLNSSAANAFKKYKYLPGQQGWIKKTFTFNLHGDAEEIPGKLKRE